MIDIKKIKKEIVKRVKPLNPEKVILFGSYAYGIPTEDSDIDIYIVTKDDFIPNSWSEKNNIYLKYARVLRPLKDITAIDLIVHTQKMHEKFLLLNGTFCNEIQHKGIMIYE